MANSSNDEQEKRLQSRYSLVIAVAKRAKQIREGSPTLVECKSTNSITCALEEIAQGKIKLVSPSPEEMAEQEHEAVAKPEISKTAELLKVPDQFDVEEDAAVELKAEDLPEPEEEEELPETGEEAETDEEIDSEEDSEEDAG
jgi:DNA-directed RNA polymerase subunit omega